MFKSLFAGLSANLISILIGIIVVLTLSLSASGYVIVKQIKDKANFKTTQEQLLVTIGTLEKQILAERASSKNLKVNEQKIDDVFDEIVDKIEVSYEAANKNTDAVTDTVNAILCQSGLASEEACRALYSTLPTRTMPDTETKRIQ